MSSVEEEYIFLRSSVKSYTSEENSQSSFLTILSSPIVFAHSEEYEIALLKVIYSPRAQNLKNGSVIIKSFAHHNQMIEKTFVQGQYELPEGFWRSWSSLLDGDKDYYKLSYDSFVKRFKITCTPGPNGETPFIKFSENLQSLVGFQEKIDKAGEYYAQDMWDATGGFGDIIVLSNVVQRSYVGNKRLPILQNFTFKGGPQHSMQLEYEPSTPVYIPLTTRYIDNIEIRLTTSDGDLFPFIQPGETIVLVHIRPKVPRLG